MTQDAQNLIWLDMEMTGLNPDTDQVLEIAMIVTDKDLNVLAEGPVIAVHQPDAVLDAMDDWCTRTHTASGLVARVKASTHDLAAAQALCLAFMQQWVPQGASPMCGNSIGQDRRFMVRYLPEAEAYFHYRNLDVSTIKELVRRWKPELLGEFKKQGTHLALDDIRESIAELRFYRERIFTI
ncbi:oligoribonuclease [Pseudaeromonas paramecii]|uniref:Oligoribonuclease n=1 Tax=Pseudaeromonas paramecii TaxID=2138166 RepID=A0ABP8QB03_9GAMM